MNKPILFSYDNFYYKKINKEIYDEVFYAGTWCFDNFKGKGDHRIGDDYINFNTDFDKTHKYLIKLSKELNNSIYLLLKSKNSNLNFNKFNHIYFPFTFNLVYKTYTNWMVFNEFKKREKKEIISYKLNLDFVDFIPSTLEDTNLMFYSDEWNLFNFGEILKFLNIQTITLNPLLRTETKSNNLKYLLKSIVKSIYYYLKSFNQGDVVYYLPFNGNFFGELLKNKSSNELIKSIYSVFKFKVSSIEKDTKLRLHKLNYESQNDFEIFLSQFILKTLPLSLLEGYSCIEKFNLTKILNIKKTNYIVVSDFLNNELILDYLSNFSRNKIFTYQHGGGFGFKKINKTEQTENFYSDNYLTWGWKNSNEIPFLAPFFKNLNLIDLKIKRIGICIMLIDIPKFAPLWNPQFYSRGFSMYLDSINFLYSNLEANNRTKVRLYPRNDSGIKFSFREKDIDKSNSQRELFSKYELYIYTYNSTGFLQFWQLKIPCILFVCEEDFLVIDKKHKSLIKKMIDVNLIFLSTEKLIAFISNKNFDFQIWFNLESTQNALNVFMNYFCNSDIDKVNAQDVKPIFNLNCLK